MLNLIQYLIIDCKLRNMKQREAVLIPKYISIRVEENKFSIQYLVKDSLSGITINDAWINFTPSQELMKYFENEIELAIKTYEK